MEIRKTPLETGEFYHIYNRGINKSEVFFEEKNYHYFLNRYSKFVSPFVETFCYCLLPNHFHLLVRPKEIPETLLKNKSASWHYSNAFSSFLQSYSRAINKHYNRTGPLFESPFKRIHVNSDSYFTQLISYIHLNPLKHRVAKNFQIFPYSSYQEVVSQKETIVNSQELIDWYGSLYEFEKFHQIEAFSLPFKYLLED